MPKFVQDLLERTVWTAAQAGLGVITVEALHVPIAYAAVVAAALAVVKGFVAKKIGNTDSASTAPGV